MVVNISTSLAHETKVKFCFPRFPDKSYVNELTIENKYTHHHLHTRFVVCTLNKLSKKKEKIQIK